MCYLMLYMQSTEPPNIICGMFTTQYCFFTQWQIVKSCAEWQPWQRWCCRLPVICAPSTELLRAENNQKFLPIYYKKFCSLYRLYMDFERFVGSVICLCKLWLHNFALLTSKHNYLIIFLWICVKLHWWSQPEVEDTGT